MNTFVIHIDVRERLLALSSNLTPKNVDDALKEAIQLLQYALKSNHKCMATYGSLFMFIGICYTLISTQQPLQYYIVSNAAISLAIGGYMTLLSIQTRINAQ